MAASEPGRLCTSNLTFAFAAKSHFIFSMISKAALGGRTVCRQCYHSTCISDERTQMLAEPLEEDKPLPIIKFRGILVICYGMLS